MKTSVTKIFKFEMAHKLDSCYSEDTKRFECPVCGKKDIKSIFMHFHRMENKDHDIFIQKFNDEMNKEIDKLLPDFLQIEIISKLQVFLPFLTPVSIANKIRSRSKEIGFNTRKVSGKKRRGLNNPVHLKGVREKISKSVKEQWDRGSYKDRINGMLGRCGELSPKFDPKAHTLQHTATLYFNKFLSGIQNIEKCSLCGGYDTKEHVNVHHIDEDHNNFLPSNLEPLCVPCHMSYHQPQRKLPFVTIGKTFTFAAAHQLPGHKGLCQYQHGHEWKLIVKIRKRINFKSGMVMDFSDLKKIVKEHIISVLDHNNLNEIIYNPTAENILVWIWEKLMFNGLLKGIYEIHLWESKDSSAIMDQKGMLSVFTEKVLKI